MQGKYRGMIFGAAPSSAAPAAANPAAASKDDSVVSPSQSPPRPMQRRATITAQSAASVSPKFLDASPSRRRNVNVGDGRSPIASGSPVLRINRPHQGDILESSVVRSDGDMELIHALRRHVAALEEDVLVKDAMNASLGLTVLTTKQAANEAERKVIGLDGKCSQLQQALVHAEAQLQEACLRASSLDARLREREDAVASAKMVLAKPLEEEVTALRSHNAALEAQMVDWKSKVKDALKEGKKREQQLTSSAIVLQTEIKQLQEKLSETTFQLQASSALHARQRASKEVQTEQLDGFGDTGASWGFGSQAGSPQLDASIHSGGGIRRRRSIGGRDRAGSVTFSPLAAVPSIMVDSASNGPPLPLRAQRGAVGNDDGAFPLPLNAQLLTVTAPNGTLNSPRLDESAAAPQPPPFIVTVHYSTPGGWSIDSKHRVHRSLTVEGLMQQCAVQFSERYHESIDVATMCIRINHDKAKRSVVLCRNRLLHSYSIFQRCQREGIAIVLFLAPRDELQEYVQLELRRRFMEETEDA